MRTSRFWLTIVALVALIGLILPTAEPARTNAAVASDATADPITTPANPSGPGVMGSAFRGSGQVITAAAQTGVCPPANPLQGIDVSQWQGTVNWSQVAQSGRAFAYARAAHAESGTINIDPTFQTNFNGIRQAGMKAGAYLYFDPAQDPTAQANTLVSQLRQASFGAGDLAPAIDVEVTDGLPGATVAANLQTTINAVQQQLGTTPVIYTAPLWWSSHVGATNFGTVPLWTANWGVSCPGVPNGWTSWRYWQYTDSANVPGVSTLVDADAWCQGAPQSGSPTPASNASYRVFLPLVFNQC